jgi:ubiquinone biosynthesis protein
LHAKDPDGTLGSQPIMLKQTFRNIGRVREIISILIKYGFEDIVVNSTLRNFVSEKRRINWSRNEKPVFESTRWERIRMVVEELGPTFVKLAQIMSNRPDMLPEPLIREFEKLQDKVPPFSYAEVRRIIKEESGNELEDIYAEFNPEPLASASIGQVHMATLHNGNKVVVKVQRPEAQEAIERDLTILADIVRRADRYLRKQGVLNASEVVKVFERSMTRELDYNNEGRNIQKFRALYAQNPNLYIPKVYKEFTNRRMLTMEYTDGCKITNIEQLKAWKLSPEKLVEKGMGIYLEMIFEQGSFHADPHPGNVLVNSAGKIVLIDFGMVGHLMRRDKYNFSMVFISIAQQDARAAADALRKLAIEENITDSRAFEYDIQELITDYASLDVSEASIADMITRLQKIMLDYQLKVPGDIYIIFRALAILEGIGKIMHPSFRTYDFIKPWGAKVMKERLKPKNIYYDLNARFNTVSALVTSLPYEVKQIMQAMRKGKLRFEVEHQGYGYLLKKLDSLTNRLAITFLIVALLISSSIMATVTFPAHLMSSVGLNYFSVAGLWIASLLCIILFYSIFRRRKYK